jgi:PIN domain nuclease of toxin-antitoxin system
MEGSSAISALSYWEVMIKAQKGLLDVGDPRLWWAETLDTLAVECLPFRPEHVNGLHELPRLHHDPFDRGLIAQCIAEDLTMLTPDRKIAQYASKSFRIVG